MAKVVQGQVTINFSTIAGDIYLKLELYSEKNGDKTNFQFNTPANFKVYTNADLANLAVMNSAGNVFMQQSGLLEDVVDEIVVFDEPEASWGGKLGDQVAITNKSMDSNVSWKHVGGVVQNITVDPTDKTRLIGSTLGLSIYRVSYKTTFSWWILNGVSKPIDFPSDVDYPVYVIMMARS